MVDVSFDQLHAWLTAFLWPFMRLSGFFLAAPLLGHSAVPNRVKIGLAALLCIVVAPALPPLPAAPVWSWAGLGIVVEQTLIGVAMGLALRMMFTVVQAAGEFIGLQMGLAFATFVSPDGANTMILSRLFYMITLLMFLAVGVVLLSGYPVAFCLGGVALMFGIGGLLTGQFALSELTSFGELVRTAMRSARAAVAVCARDARVRCAHRDHASVR